ncbi:MAG: hypothetical protein Q8O67_09780 [Deltaproteobacteria bacterium]|nr:hypothetical protein [Deltaproteobacteria bacterium]
MGAGFVRAAPRPASWNRNSRAAGKIVVALFLSVSAQAQTPPEPPDPLTGTPPAAELISADQRFKRGKNLFAYRDCPGAITTLGELAVPGQLAEERDQIEVHRMLGICHALVGTVENRREATREFSSLLSIDPDFQLDPFEVPPPVVELFDTQKQAMKVRLDEIRKARERAKEDNYDDGGVLVERTTSVRVTPLPVAFVPLGLAQLANGDLGWAVTLGAIQGSGLVLNVIGYWGSLAVQRGVDDGFTKEEVDIERPFLFAQDIGLGMMALGYAVGVGQALWSREDELILAEKQTKRPLTSSELKKLKRIERAPDPPPSPPGNPPSAP